MSFNPATTLPELQDRIAGGLGGFGEVYTIRQSPHFVAKIDYKEPLSPARRSFCAWQAQQPPPIANIAWPRAFWVYERPFVRTGSGHHARWVCADEDPPPANSIPRDVGCLVLPFVKDSVPLFAFLDRYTRMGDPRCGQPGVFPHATYADMCRVAYDLAAAVAAIHAAGWIITDLNSQNVRINRRFEITFIDVDSWRHPRAPANWAPTIFGFHVAPEVKHYRRPSQVGDCFTLGYLLFQLLNLGAMPFAYDADPHRFQGLKLPPNSIDLRLLTPELKRLFELAFDPDPARRPTAAQFRDHMAHFHQGVVA
jgi:DNA-binding helix-hairpin-helix protein with protein kinase domain